MKLHFVNLSTCLVLYLVLASAYYGWGRLCSRLLHLGKDDDAFGFHEIWLGWAFSLLLLQVLNLFFPIDSIMSILLLGGGVVLSVPSIRTMPRKWRERSLPGGFLYLLILFTVACWVASRAMLPPSNYDSGLYHLNAIRWLNSYHVITGIGNLHGRLAFNQSFFTYAASLNFYPYFNQGRCIANSFLFMLLFSESIRHLFLLAGKPSEGLDAHPFVHLPWLMILPLLCWLAVFSNGLTSPTPDFASVILQLLMFVGLVRSVARFLNRESQDWEMAFLAITAVTSVTVKMSNLVFALGIFGWAFFCFVRRSGNVREFFLRSARFVLPLTLILVVWVARGIIMSGYPLFPATLGRLPVDWAVPLETARNEVNFIYGWSRHPDVRWQEVLGSWDWLDTWFTTMKEKTIAVVYPSLLTLCSLFLFFLITLYARIRSKSSGSPMETIVLLPCAAGLVFWFFMAPDIRFAHALFWTISFGSVLVLLSQIRHLLRTYVCRVLICLALLHFCLAYGYNIFKTGRPQEVSTTGFHPIQVAELEEKKTLSGFAVQTVEPWIEQCWDSDIPCTPCFDPNLRLRGRDILSGFTVNAPEPAAGLNAALTSTD